MGGKKKTKWRKLPLEEFTKEIPSKPEKVSTPDVCQGELSREENSYISSCSETSEIVQNYAEPYECIDGVWYPTTCVVYNPGLYSNYVMPVDPCCYYYTVPEAGQMQEYVPVTYQEYTPALPKDTVYLLLPTQTLRPPQPVQSTLPEWQNRRRRRRYEGFADYAVIPERPSSSKNDEKGNSKVRGQYVNPRGNSNQSKNFWRMTSSAETSTSGDYSSDQNQTYSNLSDQNQIYNQSNTMKKSSLPAANMNNEKGPNFEDETHLLSAQCGQQSNRNLEICGVHSRNKKTSRQETANEKTNSRSLFDEMYSSSDVNNTNDEDKTSNDSGNISKSIDCDNSSGKHALLDHIKNKTSQIKRSDKTDSTDLYVNNVSEDDMFIQKMNQEIEPSANSKSLSLKDEISKQIFTTNKNRKEDAPETDSQSSLPDILSSLNKVKSEKLPQPENSSPLSENADLDKGRNLKSKSLLSQTSYLPMLSSEVLHNEVEMELRQLQNLHSLQANQSIYKLAYDENLTDQSEADSRSPSPVDPESQVPSSLTSAEIIIHEADSGSDAGSEDVELLPHRYESETFLNENKHVYVNKLSLAVELLRTQESLPYDDEFKRVVGENNVVPRVHTGGKVNMGFTGDAWLTSPFSKANNSENKSASTNTEVNEVTSQNQLKHSAHSSNDSAIFSDVDFGNLEDELCESANEVVAQGNETQENAEEIRVGYRRFGIQAPHYFSPRGALSLNPCFCCIIM